MVEKDYLLRQIEKIGVILAGIRERALSGAAVEALAELRLAAAQAGVGLEFLDSLAPDSLIPILGEDNLVKLLPAAEVLALKAEIEGRLEQTEESARSREKAAILVRRVGELVGEGGDPELRARIEELIRRIEH